MNNKKPLLQSLSELAKLREFESKKINEEPIITTEKSFRSYAKMGLVYLALVAVGGATFAVGSYLAHDEAQELEQDMTELQEDINMMDLEIGYTNGEIIEQETIIEKANKVISEKRLIVQNKKDIIINKKETIFHKRCILAQLKQERGLPVSPESSALCLKELGENGQSPTTNEASDPSRSEPQSANNL
jgi:hypothetical protein